MELIELDKVCKIKNGYAFKSTEFQKKGVPLLRISNFDNGDVFINDKTVFVEDKYLDEKEDFKVEKGDVLIALSGATTGKYGVYNFDYPSLLNQRIGLLKSGLSKELSSSYFYYYLNVLKKEILRKAGGAAQPNISTKAIGELKIPLPPLETQKKIAAILDAADSYKQKTKALIDKYDALTQSLFLDMFGDPVTNPKGWKFLTIEEVLEVKSQNGHYAPKDHYIEEGIEMVHMSDAFYQKVLPGSLKKVKADENLIVKYELKPTDLLLSRRSLNYEGAAQPCLIPEYDKPLIYESSLIRLRPRLDIINTLFLYNFLSENRARKKYVFKHVTKSTISGINNKGLNAIQLYIPPIDLQNQFAERVQAIEAQKAQAQQSLQKAEDLFNSLLQKVFKGELV